jgi:hypothetical protein
MALMLDPQHYLPLVEGATASRRCGLSDDMRRPHLGMTMRSSAGVA